MAQKKSNSETAKGEKGKSVFKRDEINRLSKENKGRWVTINGKHRYVVKGDK